MMKKAKRSRTIEPLADPSATAVRDFLVAGELALIAAAHGLFPAHILPEEVDVSIQDRSLASSSDRGRSE